ncbi:MAG: hypothetical protein Q7W45_10720 [Bacteroidota bacterium]|nr:hypothetical protein [Bacteroidota bacterium]MDP3146071.1 hypothetical protein [Bacteroidota bacterium]MDP3558607.1 hypothetical protein [Bacteroidota bacterium]
MDIKERLTEEHSRALTIAIVNYIGDDNRKFKILIDIFFNGETRLIQRSAWPLSIIAIEHPKLIAPYLSKLIKILQQPNNHPAVPRNILRIFQEIGIPKKHEGILVDICFKIITDAQSPIASKAFGITVATAICKKYPDLKNELRLHLMHMQNYPLTPAIKVRIKRAIKEL